MGGKRIRGSYPKDFFSGSSQKAPRRVSAKAQPDNVVVLREAYQRQYGHITQPETHQKCQVTKKRDLPEMLSVQEVAERLGRVSRNGKLNIQYVYELIKSKKLKGFKEGKYYRVFVSDFAAYLESLRAGEVAC